MRGVVRGFFAICLGVFVFAPPVSAATVTGGSTVITGRVLPVRYVVVDEQGVIQRIISNTPENVTPKVHLGAIDSPEIPLSADLALQYEKALATLDMERPADYVRKPPLKPSPVQLTITHLQQLGIAQLKSLSQVTLPALMKR